MRKSKYSKEFKDSTVQLILNDNGSSEKTEWIRDGDDISHSSELKRSVFTQERMVA